MTIKHLILTILLVTGARAQTDDAKNVARFVSFSVALRNQRATIESQSWFWRRERKYQQIVLDAHGQKRYRDLVDFIGKAAADHFLDDSTKAGTTAEALLHDLEEVPGMDAFRSSVADFLAEHPTASVGELFASVHAAEVAVRTAEARATEADDVATGKIVGVVTEPFYSVSLVFQKISKFDPYGNALNRAKDVRQTIPVNKATYEAWTEDTVLSTRDDDVGFYTGNGIDHYDVKVESRDVSFRFQQIYAGGTRADCDVQTYHRLSSLVGGADKLVFTFDSAHYEYFFLGANKNSAVTKTQPLTRTYVSLSIQNESAGFDYIKYLRNQSLVQQVEYELPQGSPVDSANWRTGFNANALLFSGRYSNLNATVNGVRRVQDPKLLEVELESGMHFVAPPDKLPGR